MASNANLAEDADNTKTAKIIRSMQITETKSRAYRKYNSIKNGNRSGLSRVEVPSSWPTSQEYDEENCKLDDPKEATSWRTVVAPNEIEFLLKLRNRRHFGQSETEGTPFTTKRMKEQLNWNATTQAAELVLEGKYEDDELDTMSKIMLDNFTRATDLDSLSQYVTVEEFRGKIKVWRESVSTSPSGRHLGTYKALFQPIDYQLEENLKRSLQEIQKDISQTHVHMINYAIKHRHAYDRWKNITNVMILKDPDNYKIHRLRIIHLFECDYNFFLGLKWKDALHKAQKEKTLDDSQYGSRPGRCPQTVTLMEELRLDYSQITRTPYVNMDCDASSCYDRRHKPNH